MKYLSVETNISPFSHFFPFQQILLCSLPKKSCFLLPVVQNTQWDNPYSLAGSRKGLFCMFCPLLTVTKLFKDFRPQNTPFNEKFLTIPSQASCLSIESLRSPIKKDPCGLFHWFHGHLGVLCCLFGNYRYQRILLYGEVFFDCLSNGVLEHSQDVLTTLSLNWLCFANSFVS